MTAHQRQAMNGHPVGLHLVGGPEPDPRSESRASRHHPSAIGKEMAPVVALPDGRFSEVRPRWRERVRRLFEDIVDALSELPEIDGF